jgi:excisionase family DNA binding protein
VSRSSPEPRAELTDRLALRPAEVARALGLSERTIRQILPQLPHLRIGGAVLVPVEGLREWLRTQSRIEGSTVDRAVQEVLASLEKDSRSSDS